MNIRRHIIIKSRVGSHTDCAFRRCQFSILITSVIHVAHSRVGTCIVHLSLTTHVLDHPSGLLLELASQSSLLMVGIIKTVHPCVSIITLINVFNWVVQQIVGARLITDFSLRIQTLAQVDLVLLAALATFPDALLVDGASLESLAARTTSTGDLARGVD